MTTNNVGNIAARKKPIASCQACAKLMNKPNIITIIKKGKARNAPKVTLRSIPAKGLSVSLVRFFFARIKLTRVIPEVIPKPIINPIRIIK